MIKISKLHFKIQSSCIAIFLFSFTLLLLPFNIISALQIAILKYQDGLEDEEIHQDSFETFDKALK